METKDADLFAGAADMSQGAPADAGEGLDGGDGGPGADTASPGIKPGGNGKAFEENLARLETLTRQLERGDLSLEDALECYKEGVALIGYCQRSLDRAAKEIEILTEGLGDERGSSG